jgi:deoxyribonuclease V
MKTGLTQIPPHSWDLTPKEAIVLQKTLAPLVVEDGHPDPIHTIAGLDLAVDKQNTRVFAACVLFSFPALEVIEEQTMAIPLRFPYVPGLLSFREGPAVLAVLVKLSQKPDVLMFDGQGRAHPRGFGLACHIGLLSGIPSLGVAKSRLFGNADEPGPKRGDFSSLVDPLGREIGRVVRTKKGVKPVYVSVGHGMNIEVACTLTLACAPRYRIPEPTRKADLAAGEFKRYIMSKS